MFLALGIGTAPDHFIRVGELNRVSAVTVFSFLNRNPSIERFAVIGNPVGKDVELLPVVFSIVVRNGILKYIVKMRK